MIMCNTSQGYVSWITPLQKFILGGQKYSLLFGHYYESDTVLKKEQWTASAFI